MRLGQNGMFATFLLAMGGILLLALGIALGKDSSWWAAWGQWVGGGGSILAAGIALWIAHEGWKRSERLLTEERQREQASKFGAWIEREEYQHPYPSEIQPSSTPQYESRYVVKYHNGSSLPVYDVRFVMVYGDDAIMSNTLVIGTLGPTNEPKVHEVATDRFAEAIQISLQLLFDSVQSEQAIAARAKMTRVARVSAFFRDGNNATWMRATDGTLEPTRGLPTV